MTKTVICLVLLSLIISLVIPSDSHEALENPEGLLGEPGYYDGSDTTRPYLVDYSTGSLAFDEGQNYHPPSNRPKRAVASHTDRLWPQGIIPFSIDANFTASERETIFDAMRHWEKWTCIRFYPLSMYNSSFGVNFKPIRAGCISPVGKIICPVFARPVTIGDGIQEIYLSIRCTYQFILHEIGHTVGFWHEHSRPDRDQYIIIYEDNIQPNRRYLFEIEPDIDSLGVTYDFNSIMHYTADLFSINDSITISSREKGITVGNGRRLSPLDIKKSNLLYKDQCNLRPSSDSRLPLKVPPPSPVNLSLWNCGEHLVGRSGQLSPPDDPYKKNTDCMWAIEAPEGHGIQFRIDGIDLECDNGGIYIYLHHNTRELENADIILCSNHTSNRSYSYNTSLQYMYVRFYTNAEVNAQNTRGFSKAEFTSYDIDECELYDFCDQGCVNLDGSYECTCREGYYWSGDFGFGCFDVNECGFDNGNCSHTCVNMGGTYRCECPAGYFLQSNKLDCVDIDECLSDNGGCDQICENTEGSFECLCNTSYILAADSKTCVTPSYCNSHTVLQKCSNLIRTAGFPVSHYAPNSNCTWIIELPAEYKSVMLKFKGISIEQSNDCVKDRLTIMNGRHNPVIFGKYCGDRLPATVQSSTRDVIINFISDGSVTDKGFSLKYKGLKRRARGVRKCGIVLSTNSTFTLPKFPARYRSPVNCTYSLVAPQDKGSRMKITFLYLDIQDADCSMDRIEVYNGTNLTPDNKMASICSGTYATEYISGSRDMTVRYIGNTLRKYRGFHASVTFF